MFLLPRQSADAIQKTIATSSSQLWNTLKVSKGVRVTKPTKRFNAQMQLQPELSPDLDLSHSGVSASTLPVFKLVDTTITTPTSACFEAPELNESRPSYMDNQATTPMDPRVLDAMLPYMVSLFGNPHSRSHLYGWEVERRVEAAREALGTLIGASRPSKEMIFTSGATESNNMAIKGIVEQTLRQREAKGDSRPVHVITTQVEHKCILASCRDLELQYGDRVRVTYLPVNEKGLVSPKSVEDAIVPGETALVSVIFVHNEIGVIQDIKAIGQIAHKYKGVVMHTDMAQAVGKIPVNVQDMNIDLASISGHKMYGPKGVGALFVNSRFRPRLRLVPQMSGGGQERGLRSGTVPSVLVIGLGKAAEVATQEMETDHKWVSTLSEKVRCRLMTELPEVKLNGDETHRYPGNLNLSFDCVEGESLIMSLRDVCAISSGSACTSASLEPSYVLRAIGVSDDLAHTSLRFGIGRFTTEEEVDIMIDGIIEAVQKLRELSPLWEMKLQGKSLDDMVWT